MRSLSFFTIGFGSQLLVVLDTPLIVNALAEQGVGSTAIGGAHDGHEGFAANVVATPFVSDERPPATRPGSLVFFVAPVDHRAGATDDDHSRLCHGGSGHGDDAIVF
ncbi:hypothetical protein SDC9_189284 [bioreactor metagenome]|uniref:Uncharacterized protein n=1 Tax=bioreactor metagenome TaxID=1076179 RepID=A0A645HU64_9ZZZZ